MRMLLGEHTPDTINKPFLLHRTFFFKALCIPCTGDFFFFTAKWECWFGDQICKQWQHQYLNGNVTLKIIALQCLLFHVLSAVLMLLCQSGLLEKVFQSRILAQLGKIDENQVTLFSWDRHRFCAPSSNVCLLPQSTQGRLEGNITSPLKYLGWIQLKQDLGNAARKKSERGSV